MDDMGHASIIYCVIRILIFLIYIIQKMILILSIGKRLHYHPSFKDSDWVVCTVPLWVKALVSLHKFCEHWVLKLDRLKLGSVEVKLLVTLRERLIYRVCLRVERVSSLSWLVGTSPNRRYWPVQGLDRLHINRLVRKLQMLFVVKPHCWFGSSL